MWIVLFNGWMLLFDCDDVCFLIGYGLFLLNFVYGGLGCVGGGEEFGGICVVLYYM